MSLKIIYSSVPAGSEPLLFESILGRHPALYICATETRARQMTEQFAHAASGIPVLYFPAWDCLPYDRVSPGLDIMSQRIDVLTRLLENPQPWCVIASVAAVLQRLPPKEALRGQSLLIQPGEILERNRLVTILLEQGYNRSDTVREEGEYAVRGGIIDFFPAGASTPARVDFFGDKIEQVRSFDAMSQTSSGALGEVILKPVSELTLRPETIRHFQARYGALFGVGKDPLYESISAGRKYGGMEHWLPLFFPKCDTVLDYLAPSEIFIEEGSDGAVQARLQTIEDYYQSRKSALATSLKGEAHTTYRPAPPELLYWTQQDWTTFLAEKDWARVTPFQVDNTPHDRVNQTCQGKLLPFFQSHQNSPKIFEILSDCLTRAGQQKKTVIICCFTSGSRDRLISILADHNIEHIHAPDVWPKEFSPGIYALLYPLDKGFELPTHLLISEQDLFGDRVTRVASKRRKADQFLLETTELTPGELVVHREYGVGRYEGLITVSTGEASHDCLCLVYEGEDKLFLPVENIERITRYGREGGENQLDRLGSAAWQARKAKVKKRIREVADFLIKIAAERALQSGAILDRHPTQYEEFCSRFPYVETDDQQQAIEDVLGDMTSGKPMDRLVCGDVGFGKTEVALRAAFVAASQGKQVAIVVPTTLLCRQHYQTFRERFSPFPYRVEQLSRFVKTGQAEKIREEIASGAVNIIIATHALLSDRIRFQELGLLIIDEEHHFGVKQKEKLKKLSANVHVLTLTATPIPRTLQMALTGVRELSLITTPPIDRLAVRTFVMPYDSVVIREAILREYYRGGQIFCVSPRLEDLEKWKESLCALIPEIRLITAHGQMPASRLEEVMNAFYDRAYDVLLSTNIIESGIDIATANTLIIHRADLLGLAQLYQLRGRVGRGKAQGYAYLTLPEGRSIAPSSLKRLEIMQTLDTLGAGFNVASHDMDIRGTGNLVGEEQSGHIREVGVELYQSLLQEMILVIRAEQELGVLPDLDWIPQINVGASVLIPEAYVPDLNLRLGLYRRIATLENRNQIDAFAAEMIDRFGSLPREVANLFELIEIKGLCRQAGIEKLDIGPKGALIVFRKNHFSNIEGLLTFIASQKGTAKLRPDHKLLFMRPWDALSTRMKGARQLCLALAQLAEKPAL